jgi:hypothetical protein
MEDNQEERYKKRVEELNKKLLEPKIKKKIDNFLYKMTDELNCDVEILFNVYPEVDEYADYMDSEDFEVPTQIPTMKLKDFVNHINKENMDYNVFIDPIYLKKGLNEINDVLTTTLDDNMIIVPISDKTNKNK